MDSEIPRNVSRPGSYTAHADRLGFGLNLSTEGGCFAKRRIMIA